MSEIRVGGFQQAGYPASQSEKMGVSIPQVLFIGQLRDGDLKEKAEEQTKNKIFIEQGLRNSVTNPARAKIDIGQTSRQQFNNRVVDIQNCFKDIATYLNSSPELELADRQNIKVKIDVGNIFAGELEKNIDSNTSLREFEIPVPKFDIYHYYKDEDKAFVLIFPQFRLRINQSFTATQPFQNKRDAGIHNLDTSFIIKTARETRFKILYRNRRSPQGYSIDENEGNTYFLDTPSNRDGFINSFGLSNVPFSSDDNNLNELLKFFNQTRVFNLERNRKITSHVNNRLQNLTNQNINKAFFLPSTDFLRSYINIIFYTMIENLKKEISNLNLYYVVVYDFLICSVFYAIHVGNPDFTSFKLLKQQNTGLDKYRTELADDLQGFQQYFFLRGNDPNFEILKINFYSYKKFKKIVRVNNRPVEVIEVIDYSQSSEFSRERVSLTSLYRDIISKDYVVEALTSIYYCATYIGDITNSKYTFQKTDSGNYNIDLQRKLIDVS